MYKRIHLFEATGDPDKPYACMNLVDVTLRDIVDRWTPCGVVALSPESDIPEGPAAIDSEEFGISLLGTVELQEGGKYFAIYGMHLMDEQVGALSHMPLVTQEEYMAGAGYRHFLQHAMGHHIIIP